MIFGYVSNGWQNHRLEDAIDLLAELGYRALGLTLDVMHLGPDAPAHRLRELRARCEDRGLRLAIETGARFLLDPRHKHRPTLIDPDADGRARRLAFYRQALAVGEQLGAELLSFWSGRLEPGLEPDRARAWLVDGCRQLTHEARERGLLACFEPEPGMLVERTADGLALAREVDADLRLTIDLGHLACVEQPPWTDALQLAAPLLAHVHVDDIRDGVHVHLPLGEGEIDFAPLLATLQRQAYTGMLLVELSRDSHRAPDVAAAAIAHLRRASP